MQNITTECSNIINYNNGNNNRTLTTSYHFHRTRCGQTDQQHYTDIKLVAKRLTDRLTDIATYRAAIAAKNTE